MTQILAGLKVGDWTAFYRLLSRGRFAVEAVSKVLLAQMVQHVDPSQPLVVGVDGTQIWRTSRKLEGVGWHVCFRTPKWKPGIHLAQRWLHLAWLTPMVDGFSRAIPLRLVPAFSVKAKRVITEAASEWAAASGMRVWLRAALDSLGRAKQTILVLGDGGFDVVEFWSSLPRGVVLLVRTATNRVLYHPPPPRAPGQKGRPRKYAQRALTPQQQRHVKDGTWRKVKIKVRGHERTLSVTVQGPFLRKDAPNVPLMLIVVRGQTLQRRGKSVQREPVSFLVNAVKVGHDYQLPFPLADLLAWTWQRWELEVTHRAMKTTFGVGHKQCFNPKAAVVSVQWSACCFALAMLAAYRAWSHFDHPKRPAPWYAGSRRWTHPLLFAQLRTDFLAAHDFYPACHCSSLDLPNTISLRHLFFEAATRAASP